MESIEAVAVEVVDHLADGVGISEAAGGSPDR
jgi:hypothetical protein